MAPVYEEMGREAITVLAKPGDIEIRVHGSDPRRPERVRELLGDAVYSERGDDDLETVVGRLLLERGESVATAESCTGGLVAQRITGVAGSSAWFLGGVVAYANEAKTEHLGVSRDLLARHGAVSAEVARAMARGALERFHSEWALSVTGIAGPGGGSEDKPVGTVHLGIASAAGAGRSHAARFSGDRARIRRLSGQWGLDLLRRELLGLGDVA